VDFEPWKLAYFFSKFQVSPNISTAAEPNIILNLNYAKAKCLCNRTVVDAIFQTKRKEEIGT